jgi:hypothetical protein
MKFRFIRTSWEGKFPAFIRPSAAYLRLLRQMAGKKFRNWDHQVRRNSGAHNAD